MRTLFLLLMLTAATKIFGQHSFAAELQLAETQFSLQSQIYGLRYGFLHHLDTGAMGINKRGFSKLYTIWKGRPEGNGPVLVWEPKSIFNTPDGLVGLSSGPYFTLPPKDSVLKNTGYFFTIWQRPSVNTPFKIIFDAGFKLDQPVSIQHTSQLPLKSVLLSQPTSLPEGWQAQSIASFQQKTASHSLQQALQQFCIQEADVMLTGYGRLTLGEVTEKKVLTEKMSFERAGSSFPAKSLFMEWGVIKQVTDAATSGYYLHVWSYQSKSAQLVSALYRFE